MMMCTTRTPSYNDVQRSELAWEFVFCCTCRQWKKAGMKKDKGSELTPWCVWKSRTAASDVDCCCLLRVLGSFLFSHCSWRHSLSNRTYKTLHIHRVNKPIRLKLAQSISDNTLEQTVILTQANMTRGEIIFKFEAPKKCYYMGEERMFKHTSAAQ